MSDSVPPVNVLIVDNSKMIRAIIREELTSVGFRGVEADSPEKVYEILSKEQIDLITLSAELPGKSGYDLCRDITSEKFVHSDRNYSGNRIPIIFITSNDTIEGRAMGFKNGAADFLSKPFAPGEVAHAVKNLLYPETTLIGVTAVVVEPDDKSRMILMDFLSGMGVIVFDAKSADEGFNLVEEYKNSVDLILATYRMPDGRGDRLSFRIRKELGMEEVPILILSDTDDKDPILEIFRSGATDYLHKPFIKEELLGRLQVHLRAALLNKKLMNKVNEMENMNQILKKMASLDNLTGLPNRRFFFDKFQEAMHRRDRYKDDLGLMLVDIDHFKKVNDTYGHQTGDLIIKEVANVIRTTVRRVDIVGRVGGEEFGLLVSHIDKKNCMLLGARLGKKVAAKRFKNHKGTIGKVTISIGCFLSQPNDGLTVEEIYDLADENLYRAKSKGRNCIVCRSGVDSDKPVKVIKNVDAEKAAARPMEAAVES